MLTTTCSNFGESQTPWSSDAKLSESTCCWEESSLYSRLPIVFLRVVGLSRCGSRWRCGRRTEQVGVQSGGALSAARAGVQLNWIFSLWTQQWIGCWFHRDVNCCSLFYHHRLQTRLSFFRRHNSCQHNWTYKYHRYFFFF